MTNMVWTIKMIAQQGSIPSEGGLTVTSPYNPLESFLIISAHGQSGIELQNKLRIIVTLKIHKPYKTQPLNHLNS
jgi:hypothetical protein